MEKVIDTQVIESIGEWMAAAHKLSDRAQMMAVRLRQYHGARENAPLSFTDREGARRFELLREWVTEAAGKALRARGNEEPREGAARERWMNARRQLVFSTFKALREVAPVYLLVLPESNARKGGGANKGKARTGGKGGGKARTSTGKGKGARKGATNDALAARVKAAREGKGGAAAALRAAAKASTIDWSFVAALAAAEVN